MEYVLIVFPGCAPRMALAALTLDVSIALYVSYADTLFL